MDCRYHSIQKNSPQTADMASMQISQVAYLVGSQVATKAVTFASNQVLLRRLSPEVFGVAAYLEFLVNTVLFFSREAVRIANQRAQSESASVNFAYLPVALCGPIFAGLLYLQAYSDLFQGTVAKLPHFGLIMALTIASVVLELLTEPFFAMSQHRLNFKLRSKVESFAVFVKCVTVFAAVACWQNGASRGWSNIENFKGQAVLSFALGHFMYALVLILGYWAGSKRESINVSNTDSEPWLDPKLLSIWRSLFLQMIFKHLLTEGDTLLTSYLFTVSQQGVYSVISNYGSIIARLLFQPIEESLRVSFTRALAQKDVNYARLSYIMSQIMTLYLSLSVLIVIGGYTNGSFLLQILLGRSEKWSQSSVFKDFPIYVLYIPFMAFNGVFEAFFSSACTQSQISQFSLFMSLSSVFVFAVMYLLIGRLDMGIKGLIISNMANMSLRIVYCSAFYIRFCKKHAVSSQQSTLRKWVVPCFFLFGAQAVHRTLFVNGMTSSPYEFAQSLLVCFGCLGGLLYNEREQVLKIFSAARHKGKLE